MMPPGLSGLSLRMRMTNDFSPKNNSLTHIILILTLPERLKKIFFTVIQTPRPSLLCLLFCCCALLPPKHLTYIMTYSVTNLSHAMSQ